MGGFISGRRHGEGRIYGIWLMDFIYLYEGEIKNLLQLL
jgi:hypothetical protein